MRQEISLSGKLEVTPSNRALNLPPWLGAFLVFGMIACLATIEAAAQDTKPQTQTDAPSTTQPSSTLSKVSGVSFYNLLQEKSIVFPDIAASTEPLSPGQKFQLFVDNSISVHTITWAALGSAVGQADNSPTGFGQGWDAYAKRFGTSMARQSSSEFFGTFILASALHQDPRFYPESHPGFGHAVKYSVQRVFITRTDDWPDRNRTVGDTFLRYGLDIATRAGGNMLREYWPVFYGKIHHVSRPSAGHN